MNKSFLKLEDSCIQTFHLGRYIVEFTAFQGHASNENFEYDYSNSKAFLQFVSNWSIASDIKPNVIQRNVT